MDVWDACSFHGMADKASEILRQLSSISPPRLTDTQAVSLIQIRLLGSVG